MGVVDGICDAEQVDKIAKNNIDDPLFKKLQRMTYSVTLLEVYEVSIFSLSKLKDNQ